MIGLVGCEKLPGMDELRRIAEEYQQARQAVADVRERLAAAIADAARAGVRQADIVKATGYTRETVRQVCRTAGVEPGE